MRTEIVKLRELGRMPNETLDDDESIDLLIEKYGELLDNIEKPLSYDEATVLISFFPENAFYDLQWELLHLIESVYSNSSDEEYIKLIEKCPSKEWQDILLMRFANIKE